VHSELERSILGASGGYLKQEADLSPQQSSRPRPQSRKSTRPAEFKQNKALSVRAEYHHERIAFMRTPRDYFSPYAVRQ
jgi:hypothetical protein